VGVAAVRATDRITCCAGGWMRRIAVGLALGGVLAVAGCASIAKRAFQNPIVTVADTKVTGFSARGGSLEVTLRVENPNDFRLDVGALRYVVWVDSTQVATGQLDRIVTLEPAATSTVVVPVQFALDAVAMVGVRFLTTGSLQYRVTGQFDYVTPFGRLTRPFASDGSVRR
jgi:LEA14-like dessication related protein